MIYGIRYSDKCSDKELRQFRQTIIKWLKDNFKNLNIKVRAFNCFGGKIKIYTGNHTGRVPTKARRRLIAYRNPDGGIDGENQDAINTLYKSGGDYLYQRHFEPIIEPEYYSIYRTEWNDNEKEELTYWLKDRLK